MEETNIRPDETLDDLTVEPLTDEAMEAVAGGIKVDPDCLIGSCSVNGCSSTEIGIKTQG